MRKEKSKNINKDSQFKYEIIRAYRQLIISRYDYSRLKNNYNIPVEFTSDIVKEFKYFFINYIYPDVDSRMELEVAFNNLDGFIKNPKKLIRLLMGSSSLIFKYGLQLSKMFNAGMKTLKSFRSAVSFENQLVKAAEELNLSAPYTENNIRVMISRLKKSEIDEFVNQGEQLFKNLLDRRLLENTIEITAKLIGVMKSKPKIFDNNDIKGLAFAHEMLCKGNELFYTLSTQNQRVIIDFVTKVEREEIETIFNQS